MDVIPRGIDELLHFRVPALALMAEMHPGLEKLLHCYYCQIRLPP
jgi:hypothetical protein